MRVALVHDFLYTFGGAEQVLKELCAMYPEAPVYTAFAAPKVIEAHFAGCDIRTSSLQRSWLKKRPRFLLFRMPRAVEEWDFSEYDLVISSSGAFSHGIITGPATRHICYCHSPMRYAWDWHAENLRERGLAGGLLGIALQRRISSLRIWDSLSAKRVDVWLANSATVRDRIRKYYRAEAEVVYPPVPSPGYDPALPRADYAVTVGRLSANKHVEIMVRACHDQGIPLTVVGDGAERGRLEELARGLGSQVTFAGRVSDEERQRLLGGALAFLFAAEDDFGIAPVEALAAGTPVIALGRGGATEYVEDGRNGLLFPEQTAASLEMALARFKGGEVALTNRQISATAVRFAPDAFRAGIRAAVGHA